MGSLMGVLARFEFQVIAFLTDYLGEAGLAKSYASSLFTPLKICVLGN